MSLLVIDELIRAAENTGLIYEGERQGILMFDEISTGMMHFVYNTRLRDFVDSRTYSMLGHIMFGSDDPIDEISEDDLHAFVFGGINH